ncbi:MAG: CsbD family protein [Limnobacter sp.]|uniref:CsbD family protein n=1 Tax=Limnobacter sp. TaxID=2003368 RepID=UPI00391DAFC3
MNKDIFQGNWLQIKGKVQQQWGKLTDDDLNVINGRRNELAGKLQERYGYGKEEAEKRLKEWESKTH